jgi:hypothetical protein
VAAVSRLYDGAAPDFDERGRDRGICALISCFQPRGILNARAAGRNPRPRLET